jgi:hypothetical protein
MKFRLPQQISHTQSHPTRLYQSMSWFLPTPPYPCKTRIRVLADRNPFGFHSERAEASPIFPGSPISSFTVIGVLQSINSTTTTTRPFSSPLHSTAHFPTCRISRSFNPNTLIGQSDFSPHRPRQVLHTGESKPTLHDHKMHQTPLISCRQSRKPVKTKQSRCR